MAKLEDVPNEFIRTEIEEFVERDDERARMIDMFSACSPEMLQIAAALIEGEDDVVDELTRAALDNGVEALEVMDDGLIAGMALVGIKFRENFIFVPEVLSCARAMKAGMAHIEPILADAYQSGYRGMLSLEPHLKVAAHSHGETGPELFKTAADALKVVCKKVGIPLAG